LTEEKKEKEHQKGASNREQRNWKTCWLEIAEVMDVDTIHSGIKYSFSIDKTYLAQQIFFVAGRSIPVSHSNKI